MHAVRPVLRHLTHLRKHARVIHFRSSPKWCRRSDMGLKTTTGRYIDIPNPLCKDLDTSHAVSSIVSGQVESYLMLRGAIVLLLVGQCYFLSVYMIFLLIFLKNCNRGRLLIFPRLSTEKKKPLARPPEGVFFFFSKLGCVS